MVNYVLAMTDPVLAYITTKDKSEALSIGKQLLEQRLAACVNILPEMQSLYWWEGKMDSSNESVLIAKTTRCLSTDLIQFVKKIHSYSVPCVLVLPVATGHEPYLKWLGENIRPH